MPAAQISVESSGGSVYRVVVTEGRNKTTHDVTATPEDVARDPRSHTGRFLREVLGEPTRAGARVRVAASAVLSGSSLVQETS